MVEGEQDVEDVALGEEGAPGQPDLEERMTALDLGRRTEVGDDLEATPRCRLGE